MVIKKPTVILFFLFISIQAQARQVEHIEILKTGLSDSGKDEYGFKKQLCKKFKPTKEQLINYFAKAEEADYSGTWLHEYYSPCISSGTVTFTDGTYGTWGLQSSGLGGVTFKDKENKGKQKAFFYRENKWNDPFACSYGLSDEPEPGC